ncbi:MAG: DUF6266 family protein [Candidatus Pedobacter colombiensis]|uniref:DUF6266 family protein n=1 Tax=Candidatus Pedobacter colombiensis TaxID=3121371 RepID=A0AAJ6B9G0_9SPHI|nr:DUF6266 family protein [Pedobacter sp.]WEK21421.1 MAG: DUF6266 family protein [Pedobacter sp.]
MGILKSGILGGFRKKLGPAIGRRHMGQNLISALPHKSTKPATSKQLETQVKLGLLNGFLSTIDKLVNIGFNQYVKHNTEVNAAFSYNYKHAFVKDGEAWLINYPKIIYSRGHIVAPEMPQLVMEGEKITFRWLPQNQSAYCQFTDLASFLVYCPSEGSAIILLNAVNRYAKSYTIEIPAHYFNQTLHCYMNFNSGNGKIVGDSVYVGVL